MFQLAGKSSVLYVKAAMMLEILMRLFGSQDLLTSQLFDELTFYQAFRKDLTKARKSIVIESPYMTERRTRYLAPLLSQLSKRKIKIRINTRHPRFHSTDMQRQAETSIQILLKSHVEIYTYNDLRHRKLAVIDNIVLWEGSLNILSHGRSREIMRRSISPALCRKMQRFANLYC